MLSDDIFQEGLKNTLDSTSFNNLGDFYPGKVRDNYSKNGKRYIITTDRISAFDNNLGTIPFKGQVLSRLVAWWFNRSARIVTNHFIRMPDSNVLEVVECKPLLVEMVVRAYMTGTTSTSIWNHYQNGSRNYCGYKLPDGLNKNQKLDYPIITPTTKALKGFHDIPSSREDIIASGCVSENQFDYITELALRLFEFGTKVCKARNIILVDTKYEFGLLKDGSIIVIDEIHTPDSSRFWKADSYQNRFDSGLDPEPFDKDFVRRYLNGVGYKGEGDPPELPEEIRIGMAQKYIEAYEMITGENFIPNLEEPIQRMDCIINKK